MDNSLTVITFGVIANTVFCIGVLCFGIMRKRFKTRSFRKLWKPLINGKRATVVFSTRESALPWNSYRISINEAEAYEEVHAICELLGVELQIQRSNFEIPFDKELENKLGQTDLIILGSPAANPICEETWKRLEDREQPFEFIKEGSEETFRKKDGGTISLPMNKHYYKLKTRLTFKPVLNKNVPYEDKRWVKDFGIIMRCDNPFNTEKKMILGAGCHGISTYGALSMLTQAKYAEDLLRKTDNCDFLALVEFNIQNNKIFKAKILYSFDFLSKKLTDYTLTRKNYD